VAGRRPRLYPTRQGALGYLLFAYLRFRSLMLGPRKPRDVADILKRDEVAATESDSSNGRLQPRSAFTLLPDLSCPRPANSLAEYAPEPNPATGKKDLLDQLLRQNQHDSDFALENVRRNNRDVKCELVLASAVMAATSRP
jgi:hypothetical protein